ncbi:MAG: CheR family methyltransferase [Candidatus Tyrphobacter sp.]
MSGLPNDKQAQDSQSLVVTGSSAGGIEALSALVAHLRPGFPAPVVVAQHLDPNLKSRLVDILRTGSQLPVKFVEANEEMRPGTVYVVPSGCDVEIQDGNVTVDSSKEKRIKPSIDRLFSSAAAAYGDRVIAVVLSGMGFDGMAGAREVKEQGGTVIVQEPESARYSSMPSALPPSLVDFTRKDNEIGDLITELITRTSAATEDQDHALQTLLEHVRDRSGIDFLQYKMSTIRRRLSRLMAAAGSRTYEEYDRCLQRDPDSYGRLVSSFLIKVTSFFRDAQLYQALSEAVLPKLIEQARKGDKEIRLWSAGCATGEEAYSLAVLVAESLADDSEIGARIFATDIDGDAVAFARQGIYSADAFEGVPKPLLARHFFKSEHGYEVGKRIRNMTVFGQHDLGQRAPFPRIDLVLCRNVLIYFTKELQQHALHIFAFSLRDHGYLVLGKAETANPLPELFKVADSALKIFERHGARVLIPPSTLQNAYRSAATKTMHPASAPQLATLARTSGGPKNPEPLVFSCVS